jgi:hypothetical protein
MARSNDQLQLVNESRPFVFCGSPSCVVNECVRCVECPQPKRLARCEVCSIVKCRSCAFPPVARAEEEKFNDLSMQVSYGTSGIADLATCLREVSPEGMVPCTSCCKVHCFGCMDDKTAFLFLESLFLRQNGQKKKYQCSCCYWSTKPCTNPTCPNEVGVPTKRCGGCHIDRYCSVECQAVMYPNHVARCERIRARRAAAGKND